MADVKILFAAAEAAPIAKAGGMADVEEVRACWMTQYAYLGMTEPELRAAAQEMLAGGLNTVYFNVYGGGGQTFWPSKAFVAAGGTSAITTFDQTRYLVRIFREEGLTVGAWFEYGLALSSVSHPIAVLHPDWLARDSGGDPVTGENGGFVFLSPGHPEVKQLMVDMSRELAESYAFDDIQLDRFRWGRKSSGREYGYEAVTANLYQSQFGSAPPSNRNNSQWVAFREGLVNDVVEACYDAIKAANPNIVVSSAPTGSYGITQHMQRWSAWVSGGYMDLVMPQMYLTSLSSFISEFNTQRAQAGVHVDKLGVGYRAQDSNDWGSVRSQLDHARSQGIPHAALWVYHFYTSVPAIRDELDNLPLPGRPWEQTAVNPFVSDCNELFFIDDADGEYEEAGAGWIDSAQGDYFAFGSRVAPGGAGLNASFRGAV
ncbi:MAG: family 10 glycosylhydrolase, partial [Planctomycetota bacterium]